MERLIKDPETGKCYYEWKSEVVTIREEIPAAAYEAQRRFLTWLWGEMQPGQAGRHCTIADTQSGDSSTGCTG